MDGALVPTALLPALRCVGCGAGGLQQVGGDLRCPRCGRAFPVLGGVPVMRADCFAVPAVPVTPEQARGTLRRAGLAPDPVAALRVRRASGSVLAAPGLSGAGDTRWLWDTLPRAAAPGAELSGRVRVRNEGLEPFRATGDGRATVAAQWSRPDGSAVDAGDFRTVLPSDLVPGAAATLALRVRTPAESGPFVLHLSVVEEARRWVTPPLGPLLVTVGRTPLPPVPLAEPEACDPAAALRRAAAWLGDGPVLELAGDGPGGAPLASLVAAAGLAGLQARRLLDPAEACCVCADLADLPFAPASFAAVAVSGAIGEWDGPVAALRSAQAHLRPGGAVVLVGQPLATAGPDAPGALELAEYALLWSAARLSPAALLVAADRLYALLQPGEAGHGA